MSFVVPHYANKTPISLTYLNIDRMYTVLNSNNCNIQLYYQYLDFISEHEHVLPLQ